MMKKIIICLIVMALVIPCTAPLSALAEDNTIYRTWENLTWSLNYDTGELVIGGSGAFPNITRYVAYYPLSSLIPWYYAKENVKSLVIGDEITKVTSYMFTDFDNLTTVYLGSGLEEIAVSAFDFSDNIENFYVAEDNQHFTAVNGILYNKDMTSILRYPTARQGGFSIPETVTTIGGSAFEQCFHLTDIVIPETVTSIGVNAFSQCFKLTNVIIPASVTTIYDRAFFDCDGLTEIILPDNVTKLGSHAFAYCDNVTRLRLSENLKTIPAYAFCGLTSLTHLTLPRNLYEIKSNGFSECTSLQSVIMFNKLRSVHLLFDDCDNLTDIYYIGTEEDTWKLSVRPDHLFYPYNLHYGISGTLNNGIAWELESNKKTLTLTGRGAVDGSESIWAEYGEFFNCVYVSEGITGAENCVNGKYSEAGTTTINGTKYKVYAGTYTVSYDVNGGNGSIDPQTKIHDKNITLSDVRPTKEGFVFLGWSTDKHAYAPSHYSGGQFDKNANTVLYAVWGQREITEIIILSDPTKLIYNTGEPFDMSGLEVELRYNDGTTKVLTDGFTVYGYDANTPGQQTVTLVNNGVYVYFYATVLSDDITVTDITPMLSKTEYSVGEELDYKTITLEVQLSDGSIQIIHNGFTVEGFDSATAGEIVITISYGGLSEQATITVTGEQVPTDTEESKPEESFWGNSEISAEESQPEFIEESVADESSSANEKSSDNGCLLVIAVIILAAVMVIAIVIIIMKRKKR